MARGGGVGDEDSRVDGHPHRAYAVAGKPGADEALTPVAEVTRTGYAADRTPLRVIVTVAPGDRNVPVYEVGAN
jgi:hypothetical protein